MQLLFVDTWLHFLYLDYCLLFLELSRDPTIRPPPPPISGENPDISAFSIKFCCLVAAGPGATGGFAGGPTLAQPAGPALGRVQSQGRSQSGERRSKERYIIAVLHHHLNRYRSTRKPIFTQLLKFFK